MERSTKINSRFVGLDLLRIFAAFMVLIWHFQSGTMTDLPWQSYRENIQIPAFPELNSAFFEFLQRHGNLGLDVFFILSGVVIYFNSSRSNPYGFLKARFLRLYPTYIICLIPTILVYRFFALNKISVADVFFSLTLSQDFAKSNYVIAPAWTLVYEVRFYLSIFILMVIHILIRKINPNLGFDKLLLFWILSYILFFETSFEQLSSIFLIDNYTNYFLAGMLIGIASKQKSLILTFFYSGLSVTLILKKLNTRFLEANYSVSEVGLSLLMFILFFVAIKYDSFFPKVPFIAKLALATYPFYLLHNQVGLFFCALAFTYFHLTLFGAYLFGFMLLILLSVLIALRLDPLFKRLFFSNL
jgi:peptidoglycan/LPS O-acetylase OafA/YrhL